MVPVKHPGRWWGGIALFIVVGFCLALLVPNKRPHIELTTNGFEVVGVRDKAIPESVRTAFDQCVWSETAACSDRFGLGLQSPYGRCTVQHDDITVCEDLIPVGALRQVGECLQAACG